MFSLRRQHSGHVLFDGQQIPIKEHDTNNSNNKKQLVASLGREGLKPALTDCAAEQFAPTLKD